jgi:cytochrome b6-f complex iron-sulfur subunit
MAQEPEEQNEAVAEPGPGRRDFLWKVGCAALSIAGVEAAASTLRFAKAPVSYGPSQRRMLGDLARFPPGAPVYVEDAGVFILRDANGMRALSATCTHLGCTVRSDRETGGFICPCHGSRYDSEGHVIAGPAPASLPFVRVDQDRRGRLVVDLSVPVDADHRTKVG